MNPDFQKDLCPSSLRLAENMNQQFFSIDLTKVDVNAVVRKHANGGSEYANASDSGAMIQGEPFPIPQMISLEAQVSSRMSITPDCNMGGGILWTPNNLPFI